MNSTKNKTKKAVTALFISLTLAVCCCMSSRSFAQYDVQWAQLDGCIETQPGLLMQSVAYSCSRAISRNVFPAGAVGWVQFQPAQMNTSKCVGFIKASFTPPACSIIPIAFGVRFLPGGYLMRVVNGVVSPMGTYDSTDVIRIELSADSVRYYQNDIRISSVKYVAGIYNINVLFETQGGHFEYMLCSFDLPVTETVSVNMSNLINSKTTASSAAYPQLRTTRLDIGDTITRTLFRFPVDSIPPKAVIVSAWLKLYCTQATGIHASYLKMISAAWTSTTSWATKPATITTCMVPIDTFQVNKWKSINIAGMVQRWVNKESVNYGIELSLKNELLTTLTGLHGLSFNSEFASANKPSVIIQYLADPVFAVLSRQPDGGYHQCRDNNLCFVYIEEYERDENAKLCYNIYDETMTLIAGVDSAGNAFNWGSQAPLVQAGMNKYAFDLTNMNIAPGHFYLLEVINSKNEKWYLRFMP